MVAFAFSATFFQAEYQPFSVGANLSPETAEHITPKPMRMPRIEAANQNRCLPARFK
jgi:hypothetical protein